MGWHRPKCLLPIAARTILARALAALARHGTRHITLVVGYQRDCVEAETRRHAGMALEFVANTDYAITNTAYSLWLARHHLTDGFLLLNGDVVFDEAILDRLAALPGSSVAVAVGRCGAEEVKVAVDGGGRVTRIGKSLRPADALGESVGLARIDREFAKALVDALDDLISRRGERGHYYESAIDSVLASETLRCCPIGDLRAMEIDTPEDYEDACRAWQPIPE
jgi:choline kinase